MWGFVFVGYLICNKCEGYYELQPGESVEDFILKCNCGGELKVHNSFDEYYNSNTVDNLDLQDILLNDPEGAKRAHVAYLLGETKDPKYVDVLCEATNDKDGNVRRLSASALGKIGNIKAEDALIKLLKDLKPQVRQYTVKALRKIKSEKAVEHLRNMKNDKNRYVVQEVELVLSNFVNDTNLLNQKNRDRLIRSNLKRNIAKEVYNSDFRENQNHFFKFFNEHENQNIIADAPTGSGKSLIAIQIAINLERPGTVFIVTPTKDLMKQYERDFGHLEDVMLLAGKNEYTCKDYTGFSAEQCTHTKETPCKHHYSSTKDSCEYSKKISTFMDYKIVVTNYHMMLALIKIRHALEWGSSLIIWDESHKFQDIIREMTGVEYNHTRACRIIDEDLSNIIYYFFKNVQTPLEQIKTELIPYIEKYNTKEDVNKRRWIERLETQMEYRNQYDYLPAEPYEKINYKDERERCIRVMPVDYTSLSRSTFMEAAPQHLMMSGTIHYPKYSETKRLELIRKITGMKMDYIYETPEKYRFDDSNIVKKAPEILSRINYSNSRVYNDFKHTYGSLISFLVKETRNIMIHFNAKWQCENMVRALKESGYKRPVYNFHEGQNNTKTKQIIKKRFVKTGGCIIGSSLHEGIDFPGEELEVVIIGRSAYVPTEEEDKYYPGTKRRIPNKIRKTWEGLEKRGVYRIEQEEYRLKTLQQIGRLQRTSTDTGIIILCNQWSIHKDILKDFELC